MCYGAIFVAKCTSIVESSDYKYYILALLFIILFAFRHINNEVSDPSIKRYECKAFPLPSIHRMVG